MNIFNHWGNKRWILRTLLALVLGYLSLSTSVKADVLLLVHGYQGNVASWDKSGVLPVLNRFGWKPAAVLLGAPQGLIPVPLSDPDAKNKVISLQLDSEARLIGQASVLNAALHWIIDRYPTEAIIIAGHSLGGVVARLSLVQFGAPQVKALITIASPHLGTRRAYQGLNVVDDPFPMNKIKEFFGGSDYDTLNRSRGLLMDIVPAIPGKLLYWLNHQPHPPIQYFSIVRTSVNGGLGDPIVSGYSQDMAHVPAIGNRSVRSIQGFSHFLSLLDGYGLVNIIDKL